MLFASGTWARMYRHPTFRPASASRQRRQSNGSLADLPAGAAGLLGDQADQLTS